MGVNNMLSFVALFIHYIRYFTILYHDSSTTLSAHIVHSLGCPSEYLDIHQTFAASPHRIRTYWTISQIVVS